MHVRCWAKRDHEGGGCLKKLSCAFLGLGLRGFVRSIMPSKVKDHMRLGGENNQYNTPLYNLLCNPLKEFRL